MTSLSAPLVNFMKLAPRVISLFLSRQRNRECRCSSVFRLCSPTIPFRLDATRGVQSKLVGAGVFLSNRDISFFLLQPPCFTSALPTLSLSFIFRRVFHPPVFRLSSLSFSLSLFNIRASIYQTSSGEASDNRFNRWTVKEIAASTLARAPSHNVKSTESL